jgi:hypothetical protein
MKRKIGVFVVDHSFIDDHLAELKKLFKDVLVVRAESNYAHGFIEYTGISELFEEVPLGQMATKYNVIFNRNKDKDGEVTFEFRKE